MTAPMIEIPEGTRVYGMQLPIQAQSLMIAADWERDAGVDELARVIAPRRRARVTTTSACATTSRSPRTTRRG